MPSAGPETVSSFGSSAGRSALRSALRAASRAPVAVAAAVLVGAVGATLFVSSDGGGSAAPGRIEVAPSEDDATDVPGGGGDPSGPDGLSGSDDGPDPDPSPGIAPPAAASTPSSSRTTTEDAEALVDIAPGGGAGPAGDSSVTTSPPTLLGSVRLLSWGVTVERTVTLTLRDTEEDVVATRDIDATSAGTAFAFADVPPGSYTLELSGPGIVERTTGALIGPSDGTALDVGIEDVVATTTVTGTVLGFVGSPLAPAPLGGATVTFPDEAQPGAPAPFTVETGVDGTFSATIRSAVFGATGGLAPIELSATGYETRVFLPAPGRSLGAVEEVLRPAANPVFLLHPSLTRSGSTEGDVGLDLTPRAGSINVTLTAVGEASLSRAVSVRLTGGTIAGQPTRTPDGSPQTTFFATPGTGAPDGVLTTGAAGTFGFTGVPPGDYTLEILGDHVRTSTEAVTVAPGEGAFTLTARDVAARSALTITVEALQPAGGVLEVQPKEGASVTFTAPLAAAGDRDGDVVAPSTTGADGNLTVWIDAGTHAADAIGIGASAFDAETLGGALTDTVITPASIALEPSVRSLNGTLTLEGPAGITRSVEVELWEGDGGGFTNVDRLVATQTIAEATVGVNGFMFAGVRPIGDGYTLRAIGSDPNVHQVTSADSFIMVTPGTGSQGVGDLGVRARTRLVLTTTGVQRDGTDEQLTLDADPLAGVTVAVPAGAPVSSDGGAFVTAIDGTLTVLLDAGDYSSGALGPITLTRGGYQTASLTGSLADVEEDRTVRLDPSGTTFSVALELLGGSGVTRTVTLEVCGATSCGASDDPLLSATDLALEFGTTLTFTFEDELPVGVYTFRVSGESVRGETFTRLIEPADGVATVTPIQVTALAPAAPTGLTVTSLDSALGVSFDEVDGRVDRYEYQLDGGDWVPVGLETEFVIGGLTPGVTYVVRVRAVNDVGPGEESDPESGFATMDPF